MKDRAIAITLALLLGGSLRAGGQMATVRLRPAPATASAPAEAVDPAAMKILRRLETAAVRFPIITADLHYHEHMRQYGDTEERTGKVYYQAATEGSGQVPHPLRHAAPGRRAQEKKRRGLRLRRRVVHQAQGAPQTAFQGSGGPPGREGRGPGAG